jgi:hypothetical protein
MNRAVRGVLGALAVVAASAVATPAQAQVAWDSPMVLPPNTPDGIGIFLLDTDGGGIGVSAIWRSPIWNYGLRVGFAEGRADDRISIFGGLDFAGPISRANPDFPLDVDWVLGAGVAFERQVRIAAPLGLTTGHTFHAEGASFTPYLTPRVVLDAYIGDEGPPYRERGLHLNMAVDLGLDLRLQQGLLIRFAATAGQRNAVAIGLNF